MTSHDSLSHLEPDDVASNHNSDALNQISDDVDERSPYVDVLIALSCPGENWEEEGEGGERGEEKKDKGSDRREEGSRGEGGIQRKNLDGRGRRRERRDEGKRETLREKRREEEKIKIKKEQKVNRGEEHTIFWSRILFP